MQKLNITFLGTGNAIPTPLRNHTGILLSFSNENILIDCGENIQRQFKIAKLNPCKLTRILITHWHGDHILGLPGLLQTLAMSNFSGKIKIYGPKGTNHFMNIIKELMIDFRINLEINEISSGTIINEKDFQVLALSMKHGISTLAYSIIIKDKIRLKKDKIKKLKLPNSPILRDLQQGKNIIFKGKTIKASQVTYKEEGKKITIILDTSLNQNAIVLAKDSDLLIAESTFASAELEKASEYKHLTASQAATIAKKANVSALILTHISQRYEANLKIIEKEARKIFKNTRIANDFDILEI